MKKQECISMLRVKGDYVKHEYELIAFAGFFKDYEALAEFLVWNPSAKLLVPESPSEAGGFGGCTGLTSGGGLKWDSENSENEEYKSEHQLPENEVVFLEYDINERKLYGTNDDNAEIILKLDKGLELKDVENDTFRLRSTKERNTFKIIRR